MTFEVPTSYSFKTMKAIRSGVVTKTARVEIIAALHTRMLQLADYPTPQDYKLVCQKLVSVYPTLGDCNGSGYVSDTYYYYSMYL